MVQPQSLTCGQTPTEMPYYPWATTAPDVTKPRPASPPEKSLQSGWYSPEPLNSTLPSRQRFTSPAPDDNSAAVEAFRLKLQREVKLLADVLDAQKRFHSRAFSKFAQTIASIIKTFGKEAPLTIREAEEVLMGLTTTIQIYANDISHYIEWKSLQKVVAPEAESHIIPSRFVTSFRPKSETMSWSLVTYTASKAASDFLSAE